MAKLLAAPTKNAIQKTLSAELLSSAGASDPISFADVDGIPNLPGVLVINRVDSNGTATASKREYIEYSGTSGTTVLITTRNVDGSGSTLTHAVGSIVEWIPDVTWADRIYDSLAAVIDVDDNTTINSSLVTLTGTQTLTNKTISGATLSGTLAGNATFPGNIGFDGDLSIKRRKTPVYSNGSAGISLSIDMDNGETQKVTLNTTATISLANMEEGDYLTLYVEQDGTGSRTMTIAQSGGTVNYPAGTAPTLTTAASARDILGIRAFNASVTDVVASSLNLS